LQLCSQEAPWNAASLIDELEVAGAAQRARSSAFLDCWNGGHDLIWRRRHLRQPISSLALKPSRLNVLTEQIIRIEGQSDELNEKGRRELYLSEKNAIAFVIGTEVYDHLEQVVDRFEDVANEISGIVIENV
jgi:hypothetical protein